MQSCRDGAGDVAQQRLRGAGPRAVRAGAARGRGRGAGAGVSVPGDTGFKVVIRKVLLPNLLPISLEKVSESFALKLEAKPTMNKLKKFGQRQLNKASEQPVAADPHTFSGPR